MKTVILTGATGGLGKCLTRYIQEVENIELICVYRNPVKFHQWMSEENISCKGYKTRIGDDYTPITGLIDELAEEIIIILNAFSIAPIKTIGTMDAGEIDAMIDGNINQIVQILNTVIKYCQRECKYVRIINLDSGAADFPLRGWGNYCASKAYINSFLSVIALENPEFKVVSVDPGVMDTGMQETIRNTPSTVFDKVGDFNEYKETGVLRTPEEVADYLVNYFVLDWKATQLREKIEI